MKKNKIKSMFKKGEPIINGWLQIPSSFSAEVMANQGWDSLTIDMQHGVIDYPNALQMLQAISTTETTPLARVNWNEPGQIMKILDAGCYGIICPMVSNRQEAENFVNACLYPPLGYRSFGPIRGLIYGGPDYADFADEEILKLAMIETSEALKNLEDIMTTKKLDGIYIGPADLSLAIGQKPGFDNPKGSKTYDQMLVPKSGFSNFSPFLMLKWLSKSCFTNSTSYNFGFLNSLPCVENPLYTWALGVFCGVAF